MKTYQSKGLVLGKLWMGGEGAYPAERLTAKTKEALLKKARKGLEDGWLDSGMGFESLIGALLEIEEVETIKKNGKEYRHSEFETEIIGDLTEKQVEFLYDVYASY